MKHFYDKALARLSLVFDGDVLSTNVAELREATLEALGAGTWSSLEIDLTKAQMVDSAGLNLLVFIVRKAQANKARICARLANDNVRRTFSFTRLDHLIEVKMACPAV